MFPEGVTVHNLLQITSMVLPPLDSVLPGAQFHNSASCLVGLVSAVDRSGFELLDCALQPFLMG